MRISDPTRQQAPDADELKTLLRTMRGRQRARGERKTDETEPLEGLAKIGFHYFLKHMSGYHGSEDAFAAIRNFITSGKAEDVFRFISGWTNHFVVDITSGESPAGYRPLLLASSSYKRLQCQMQFFIHPKHSSPIYRLDRFTLPIYTIDLGRNPSLIDYPQAKRHSFTYSDTLGEKGYDGEIKEEPIRAR